MSLTIERVHELGVQRHKDRWFHANRRAVETLWGTSLRVDTAEVKDCLPRVILAVLDGHMLDQGNLWNREEKRWEKRKLTPTPQKA